MKQISYIFKKNIIICEYFQIFINALTEVLSSQTQNSHHMYHLELLDSQKHFVSCRELSFIEY